MTDTFLDFSPEPVSHQFEDAEQQRETSTLGMWTFLATEVLFFGVLFTGYAVYRLRWPEAFRQGTIDLKWYMGCINTAVLLLSSFTMALAVQAAALGHNRSVILNLVLTIIFGSCFLGIKATEYYLEYAEHLVPRLNFSRVPPSDEQKSSVLKGFDAFESWMHSGGLKHARRAEEVRPEKEELFMLFYFIMTAFHATHMVIGIGVMSVMIWLTRRGVFSAEYHTPIEIAGLYWHFVDIVWIFLFPVLYLLRNP